MNRSQARVDQSSVGSGESVSEVMPPELRAEPVSVSVEDVYQVFETPDGGSQLVMDGVSFTVEPAEFVSLVGASGCGKTTLLRAIAGLIRPSRGRIRIAEDVVEGPTRNSGMVFQSDALMPWRTVNGNVAIGLEVRGVDPKARDAAVATALQMVRLDKMGRHFPHELSGGMRQRVNLARALAIEPGVLLMDEPFASLDAQTRDVMQGELLRLCEALGITVILVTHQIEEAVLLADRVVVLSTGPCHVREIIRPPFPRPRDAGVKRSREFLETVDRIWRLIGQDIRRSVDDELDRVS